jgi:hypothetical protein
MRAVLVIGLIGLAGCGDVLSAGKHDILRLPSTCGSITAADAPPLPGRVAAIEATVPKNDSGTHLDVEWATAVPEGQTLIVLRREIDALESPTLALPVIVCKVATGDRLLGGWTVAYAGTTDPAITDEVTAGNRYAYAAFLVAPPPEGSTVWPRTEAIHTEALEPDSPPFNTDRWFYLAIIVLTGAAFFLYLQYAKRSAKDIFIRRIPGVDAIEDAIGRSTEMGRPILYVTGIEDIQDIQTVASLLILGHVAKMTAEYDSEIKVCNTYPMTMVVAEEVVRQGYVNAGRPDAHKPENVMFITSEQFAFAAAVNGMIVRDRPATNIYFGRFFAESLMLAETGFLTGAVQIAGTAEFTQLPFFIAACDYTLLGEELYAVSAYLSREPTLIAQLKAGDIVKATMMILIGVGVVAATVWGYDLAGKLMP